MTHYFGIVHKDRDSAFGVSFPDLPGCFSAADNASDILANAMEALELYADGETAIPAPSTVEALRGRNDVAADLAEGAYLIAVPLIINIGKSERVNITLDKGLLAAIDDAAALRKMTRSGFLAQAATNEMRR